MNGIIRASAIAMALLVLVSAAVLTDGSDAISDHGTSVKPLTSFEYDAADLSSDPDKDYYVKVGSEVNITPATVGSYFYYPSTVTSGYGLTKSVAKITGTIDREGVIEIGILKENDRGNTSVAGTVRIMAVMVHDLKEYVVTYDAGVGLVNGSSTWSETILEGSYASLPAATHSSGAYTFKGWAESPTAVEPLTSFTVQRDTTLYAVWERNTVLVSDATATVTSGQSASVPIRTNPASATLSVVSAGGLPQNAATVSGHDLNLDMTGVGPGTYYVTVKASYTGYITGESVITVKVPITIVKPIEYVLSEGDLFSYTPVTDPTNASIEIDSITIDGNYVSSSNIEVSGRTITGTLDHAGTYEIVYTASMAGYVDVTNSVFVKVTERQQSAPAPVMGTVIATPRAGEPRVYDLVLTGYSNVSNIVWSIGDTVFASSSPTALCEFPASGDYTVRCTLVGFDGSQVYEDVSIICTDNYHREAAWSGIPYRYVLTTDSEVTLQDDSPFSVSRTEVGDRTYVIISGTPGDDSVGRSFTVSADGDLWNITVYTAESRAPTSDFTVAVGDDGRTVVAMFTGQDTSFHTYDFDGDGIPESGNAFTYQDGGTHTIVCKAVNNISETSVTKMVRLYSAPRTETTIQGLTDFQMTVGERQEIVLDIREGEVITLSGSAADFCNVKAGTIEVAPKNPGVFDLTVRLSHDNGQSESVTVKVTVRGEEHQERHDYMVLMAVFFAISVVAIAAFVLKDTGVLARQRKAFGSTRDQWRFRR